MRITVIAADSATGREIVGQALGHGDDVSALVSAESVAGPRPGRARLVAGDVSEPARLREAVRGADAVLLPDDERLIGGRRVADAVAGLVRAMRAEGVHRLVVATSAGVGAPSDPRLPLGFRLLGRHLRAGELQDMATAEDELLLADDIEWTVVRPIGLTDGPQTGSYRVAEGRALAAGRTISRADLAAFMLKTLTAEAYIRRGYAVAY